MNNDQKESLELEFTKVADDLPTLCWVADKTGFIIWYNRRWHEYCGTTDEEMRGWGWTAVHDPDILPHVMEKWQHSISTGEAFEQTFPLRGKDGNFRSFLTKVVPVYAQGEIVRWLGVNIDVTEQLRIQDELRKSEECLRFLNQSLEVSVGERDANLRKTEEQLRQSQKMEAVGQLTGGIAHDFNNLLTGIMGNLELLQIRIAQERYGDLNRFVTSAQAAGNRAAALTQRLLAFSRRQTLDPKPTGLLKLISGMEEMIKRTIGPSVVLKIDCDCTDCIVLIDAPQLENALLNLCINSRDALPNGGDIVVSVKEVFIDTTKASIYDVVAGPYVKLSVSDNGCGMDQTTSSKAFEPFFTTKPTGQGTGLGLSMIYGFSRQSKGHVTIESAIDIGTCVSIFLPRHMFEGDCVKINDPRNKVVDCGKGCILLVDDEETIRYLLKEVLSDAGYHVVTAADGIDALKILESDVPLDLLITDVGLPNGLNGRQVADAARTIRNKDLKVLFITGYAEQSVMVESGFDDNTKLLTKPFGLHEVAEKAAEMMG